MIKPKESITSSTYMDVTAGSGHLFEVEYVHGSDEENERTVAKIKEAFKLIKEVTIPHNHKTNVQHGGYGRYSRFNIKQHKYAGGQGGYYEVLEILDPPDNRCRYILHFYDGFGGREVFYEFSALKYAIKAYDKCGMKEWENAQGVLRTVECGHCTPWFYAVSDQHITGDFVFPPGVIMEDPVYRFGRKFLSHDYRHERFDIKICVGAYEKDAKDIYDRKTGKTYKQVLLDDGSEVESSQLEPLEDNKIWIHNAIIKFKEFLNGKIKRFEIPFTNGYKFIGRLNDSDKTKSKSGRYSVKILIGINGEEKERDGVFEFNPSKKYPTIESSIRTQCKAQGFELFKIITCVRLGGRHHDELAWVGVYNDSDEDNSKE